MTRRLILWLCHLTEWWLVFWGMDRNEARRRIQERLDLYFVHGRGRR
jgi:hypothetical protein